MQKIVVSLILLLIIFSCEKEMVFEYRIDPVFESYVDSFFAESALRGYNLKRENLIVEFTNSGTSDFCGQCTIGKNQSQRIIKIQKNSTCWGDKFDENKEVLIFHELGHCLLFREHLDEYFEDGSPKTIMTTYDQSPYSRCIYDFDDGNGSTSCNKLDRRKYYLDELFGIEATPGWLFVQ